MKPSAGVLVAAALLLFAAPDQPGFGPHGAFRLELSKDSFGMRSHGIIEKFDAGGQKLYPLPQSSLETYMRLRPADIRMNPIAATDNRYEREEVIGPHQVEGDLLWFGNSFYDGEGMRGVGAFGYFDARTRQYRMFSPPEVAPYEVSALLVEPETVWMGLDRFGEDISTFPGGLVVWNRKTEAVRHYAIEFVVTKIAREGDSLRLTTNGGYALMKDGAFRRLQTRGDAGGKEETTPIARFPPPPSHY